MPKRGKLDIIHDILKLIQENHKIKYTPLLRKSNISSSRFKQYFNEMLKKEFIRHHKSEENFISITEKGNRFLEKYQTIVHFIDEFDL